MSRPPDHPIRNPQEVAPCALTSRVARLVAGVATVAVVAVGALGLRAVPTAGPGVRPRPPPKVGLRPSRAPDPCPLTGEPFPPVTSRADPARARGQGREHARGATRRPGWTRPTSSYEEAVEGGITRFIAVYQCGDADRVGPVRSRPDDRPGATSVQLGAGRLFGYAGGAPKVVKHRRREAGVDRRELQASRPTRTPATIRPRASRTTCTRRHADALARRGEVRQAGDRPSRCSRTTGHVGRPSKQIALGAPRRSRAWPTSYWHWNGGQGRLAALARRRPQTLEDGDAISTDQRRDPAGRTVDRAPTSSTSAGNPSPEVDGDGLGQGLRPARRQGDRRPLGARRSRRPDHLRHEGRRRRSRSRPDRTWVELAPDGHVRRHDRPSRSRPLGLAARVPG